MPLPVRRAVAAGAVTVAVLSAAAPADAKRRFENGEVVCKNLGYQSGSATFTDLVKPSRPFGALSTAYRYHLKFQVKVIYPFGGSDEELAVPTGVAIEGSATSRSAKRPKRGQLISRTQVRMTAPGGIDASFGAGLPASFSVSISKKDPKVVTLGAKGVTTDGTSVQSLVAEGANAFNPPLPAGVEKISVRSQVEAGTGANAYSAAFGTWRIGKKLFKAKGDRVPGLTRNCNGTAFDAVG